MSAKERGLSIQSRLLKQWWLIMAGRGPKPGERRGGRVKGGKNKITVSVKEALIGALNAGDGAEAFFLKV